MKKVWYDVFTPHVGTLASIQQYSLDSYDLPCMPYTRDIGFTVYSNLSCKHHISQIVHKAHQRVFLMVIHNSKRKGHQLYILSIKDNIGITCVSMVIVSPDLNSKYKYLVTLRLTVMLRIKSSNSQFSISTLKYAPIS